MVMNATYQHSIIALLKFMYLQKAMHGLEVKRQRKNRSIHQNTTMKQKTSVARQKTLTSVSTTVEAITSTRTTLTRRCEVPRRTT